MNRPRSEFAGGTICEFPIAKVAVRASSRPGSKEAVERLSVLSAHAADRSVRLPAKEMRPGALREALRRAPVIGA